jgi:MoxR-like ATPase
MSDRKNRSGSLKSSDAVPPADARSDPEAQRRRERDSTVAGEDGPERPPTPRDILARAVLESCLPPRLRRRMTAGAVAIVIEVPSAGWIAPVADAAKAMRARVFARDGSDRYRHRPDRGNDEAATDLALGRCVVGISHAPARLLPATLMAAADARIRIGPPSNKVLATVIRQVTGHRAGRIPPAVAAGLDFDDVLGALRPTSARACVRRLIAARTSRAAVDELVASAPPLSSLHGYGAAMQWGRELLEAIGKWRRGEAPWPAHVATALICGPPGTGKSTLIRSLIRATGLPMVMSSIGGLFSQSAGDLGAVIRQIDTEAAVVRSFGGPAALVIEEIDALPNRELLDARGRDWWLPVITHYLLLTEELARGHLLIATTNHRRHVDPALLRPGRLARVIEVTLPDMDALVGIFRHHLGNELAGADLSSLAALAVGASGAEVEHIVQRAHARARSAGRALAVADLLDELAPPDGRSPEALWRSAVHESAHAVAVERLRAGRVERLSVVRNAQSFGHTLTTTAEAEAPSREALEAVVVSALAGRAGEAEILGGVTTGGGGSRASDLARATTIVAALHATFGLGRGLAYRAGPDDALDLIETDPDLRHLVEADLQRLYRRALALVRRERRVIEAVARQVVERRHMSGVELRAAMRVAERPARGKCDGRG